MRRDRQPGGYVRSLAAQRRLFQRLIVFPIVFFIVAPFLVSFFLQVDVGIFVYLACFLAAGWLVLYRNQLRRGARKADKGALAEEKVNRLLAPLKKKGWHIEHNLKLPNRRSDIDFFLVSPQGTAFVVEVKGHSGRGEIVFDGQELKITRDSIPKAFPENKNFLKQVTSNARAIKEYKKLRWVEAVIVFPNTRVTIETLDKRVQNVYVVEGSFLVQLLEEIAQSES